ncbi:MAG: ATP-binding cassette domain-containing protein [Myxococcota bacterium]|nr:ATP-binding cassette domain-containing protein [Myxococcota bacterium]
MTEAAVDVTFSIQVGQFTMAVALYSGAPIVSVIGANGTGKSTLLKVLAGGQRPDTGRIQVGGVTFFDAKLGLNRSPAERRVAYIPQNSGLFPHMTATENILFALKFSVPSTPESRRDRASDMLNRFGVGHLATRQAGTFSGGERQRVALARAFATTPRLFLFDEPLAGLDIVARNQVRELLIEALTEGAIPACLVTHDPRTVEALAGSVAVLENGGVVQCGSYSEILKEPASAFIAAFFGK